MCFLRDRVVIDVFQDYRWLRSVWPWKRGGLSERWSRQVFDALPQRVIVQCSARHRLRNSRFGLTYSARANIKHSYVRLLKFRFMFYSINNFTLRTYTW